MTSTQWAAINMKTPCIFTLGISLLIGGDLASAGDQKVIPRDENRITNCAAKFESFVADIDDILQKGPRSITQVYGIF